MELDRYSHIAVLLNEGRNEKGRLNPHERHIVIELWHHGGHWSLIRRLADFDPECDYFAINTGCFNRDTIGARKPFILLALWYASRHRHESERLPHPGEWASSIHSTVGYLRVWAWSRVPLRRARRRSRTVAALVQP